MEIIDYTIISVIFIFILTFVVYVTYILYINPTVDKTYFQCPPGECSTSLTTGDKKCPKNSDDSIIYDKAKEVCNSKYTCENKATPFALMGDGSTNMYGVCAKDEICKCLTMPHCSIDNVVLFNMKNGNINQPNSHSVFHQIPLNHQGNNEQLKFSETNVNFCSIKAYHLNRISPGACVFENTDNIKLTELSECFIRNPCVVGTLAFYPKNSETFVLSENNKDAIFNIPVSCVPSSLVSCNIDEVPVFNKKNASISCYRFY